MDLKTYLSESDNTQAQLAESLGVTPGMISHWATGRHRPTVERALEIEAATLGKVTAVELRPDKVHLLKPIRSESQPCTR